MGSIDRSLPPVDIQVENEVDINDSCNCCQQCTVSCCFPFRVKRHKKHNPDPITVKVESESIKILYKKEKN